MLKYADDPPPRRESPHWRRYTAASIPTVDEVNEVLAPGTAAVIWQIMRGERYAGFRYQGAAAELCDVHTKRSR